MMKITQICMLCIAFVCLVGCAEVIDDIIASNPDILLPDDGIIEDAHIQSVEIRIAESFPVQVFVEVIWISPDACTLPHETSEARDGNTITIQMTTIRPKEGCMCNGHHGASGGDSSGEGSRREIIRSSLMV